MTCRCLRAERCRSKHWGMIRTALSTSSPSVCEDRTAIMHEMLYNVIKIRAARLKGQWLCWCA